MSNYIVDGADLTSVANAIRTKGGTSAQLAFPAGFVDAIEDIETGGSGEWTTDGIATNEEPSGAITINSTSIAAYAFYGKTRITSFSCPNVTDLYTYAFSGCTGVTSLTLPKMTWHGKYAFSGMTNLAYLSCPAMTRNYDKFCVGNSKLSEAHFDSLTQIAADQFLEGTSIETLVFPAFSGGVYRASLRSNTKLKAVDFKACTYVDGTAFSGCTVLSTLVIRGSSLTTLSNISAFDATPFASGNAGGTLYVPSALISSYQAATNWSTILGYTNNSIEAIEGSIYETQYADGTPINS